VDILVVSRAWSMTVYKFRQGSNLLDIHGGCLYLCLYIYIHVFDANTLLSVPSTSYNVAVSNVVNGMCLSPCMANCTLLASSEEAANFKSINRKCDKTPWSSFLVKMFSSFFVVVD
jgi:hypothetical protein